MTAIDAVLERFALLHPRKIDLSLDRIERLLADLGSPHRRLPPVVHVAGTNGKGSTIAFMRAALEAAGKRVHVYTSPHLVRFNERIRLAGELVDDERLGDALARCEAVNAGRSISVFEITTAAAFVLFSETPADYLLLEVGLGGRYDATNVIERPAATVITPVSIDHTEFLGATVEKIALREGRHPAPRRAGDRRRAGRARARRHRARGAEARRIAALRRTRFLHPFRARPARLRGRRRSRRPADAAARRPPSVRQRRDGGGDAAGDRAGNRQSRARARACSKSSGRRGCKGCAAGRWSRSRRRRPRSGSTAPTTKRAGARSPRRWPISKITRRGRWR